MSHLVSRATLGLLAAGMALALIGCGTGTEPLAPGSTEPAPTPSRPPTASPTTVAVTSQCPSVAFTPDSEDLASDVVATGIACDQAEAFVRAAGARTSSEGPALLRVDGFQCMQVRVEQDPLPRSFYECTDGTAQVNFVRS